MARPFVIWITVVFAVFLALLAAYGLLLDLGRLARWHSTGATIFSRGGAVMLLQACLLGFFLSVALAALRLPRWARPVCAVFALLVMAWIVWRAIYADPHPRFEIHPGDEQAGAMVGEVLMLFLSTIYAYKMVFGRTVRGYFSRSSKRGQVN